MLWFNPAKQHGFIRTEEGERLLIELSGFAPGHVLGERCAGTAVEFEREAAEVEGGFRQSTSRWWKAIQEGELAPDAAASE
jgi:cold shock CspA family protein